MNRDVAQLVSAPALGAGGPAFESQYPDRKSTYRDVSAFLFIYSSGTPLELVHHSQSNVGPVPILYNSEFVLQAHTY